MLPPQLLQQYEKAWLNPSSEALVALQNIVMHKSLLCDLKHLKNFSNTGSLKVYLSL